MTVRGWFWVASGPSIRDMIPLPDCAEDPETGHISSSLHLLGRKCPCMPELERITNGPHVTGVQFRHRLLTRSA